MKALTLYQPWATLVIRRFKKIETRSWFTTYRGPLAIHASSNRTYLHMIYSPPFNQYFKDGEILPLGAILGTVDLITCIRMNENFIRETPAEERALGEYAIGRAAWILEHVLQYQHPITAKGAQGLWEWEG